MAEASDPATSTPEYLAFRKSYPELVSTIKTDIGNFCDSLFASELITEAACEYARTIGVPVSDKAGMLVDTVRDGIKQNPANFHRFLEVIKKPFTLDIVAVVQQRYEEECKKSKPVRKVPDSGAHSSGDEYYSAPSEFEFICPICERCSFEQFYSEEGCPNAGKGVKRKRLFPYLDVGRLDEDEVEELEAMLLRETKVMRKKFADFSLGVERSLEERGVPIRKISDCILSLDCVNQVDQPEIKAAQNVPECFLALRAQRYISFYNYEIVEHIVEYHGSEEDRRNLNEYLCALKAFCQRSVFQVPRSVFSDCARNKGKMFALICTRKTLSLNDVHDIKQKVAKEFGIKAAPLQLCLVKKGCVELRFSVPTAVADRMFPVPPSTQAALSEIGLKVLSPEDVNRRRERKKKLTRFKAELKKAVEVSGSSPRPEQQGGDFFDACESGDMNRVIEVCLQVLGVKREPAQNLKAAALAEAGDGNLSLAVQLVRKVGINLEQRHTEYGRTPLITASLNAHVEIAKMLIEAGADLDVQQYNGRTALFQASLEGYVQVVQLLIDAGAALDVQKEDGCTALYQASFNGNVQVVQLLIDAGAALDVPNENGATALYVACEEGHYEVATALVRAKADLNLQINDGRTALYQASAWGHVQVVQLLIDAGAALDVQKEDGFTALSVACLNNHFDVAKALVRANADLNLQTNGGRTALWEASFEGHVQEVQLLIDAGAALDVQAEKGWTALHAACQEGHDEVITALVRAKADINVQNSDGDTPLIIASDHGHVTAVILLVEAGAVLNVRANDGLTALDYANAKNGEDSKLAKYLSEAGATTSKQLSDATHSTAESKQPEELVTLSPDSKLKTPNDPKPAAHQPQHSSAPREVKSSRIRLTKLVKRVRKGSSLITAKLRGPNKSEHSNIKKANKPTEVNIRNVN